MPWLFSWFLAISSNILVLLLFVRFYKIKSLVHPFFIFSITWLLSYVSFFIGISVGLDFFLISNLTHLNTLFYILFFNNIFILIFLFKDRKKIAHLHVTLNWRISNSFINYYTIIFVLIAIVSLITRGTDVALNREIQNNTTSQQIISGEGLPILNKFLNLFIALLPPLSIYLGYLLSEATIFKRTKFPKAFYLLIFAFFLFTFTTGGRSPLFGFILYLVIGLALSIFKQNMIKKEYLLKLVKPLIIPIILVVWYVNYVSISREKHGGYSNITKEYFSKITFGDQLFGMMEYSVFHIIGFQLRMDDTATDELEFGQYTFQFITKFNVPIISKIAGENINLKTIFNLKGTDNFKETRIAYDEGKAMHSTTATVYFILMDDFGFLGTLIVIFFFTLISQAIYMNLFLKSINSYWNIIIFVIVFDLWRSTWMSHHLNDPFVNIYIYGAIFLTIAKKLKL